MPQYNAFYPKAKVKARQPYEKPATKPATILIRPDEIELIICAESEYLSSSKTPLHRG